MERTKTLSFDEPLQCLADAGFAAEMEATVLPYLSTRRELGFFKTAAGQPLRYAKYTADEPRETVVISHGFTETLEKYDETVYYLLRRGCNVYVPEHRGHGRSFRETQDYSLTSVSCFDDYVSDFTGFVEAVVKPAAVGQLYRIAHSMGCAIGALAMERQPQLFTKAAMLSPMFGLNLPAPKRVTYALARAMCACGRANAYVMGQKPFSGEKDLKNSACACAERYDYFFALYLKNEYMQGCAASYSWLRESIRATDALMKGAELQKLQTPVMVFSGTADEVVSIPAHKRFVKEVKSATLVTVPKGRHELFTDSAERTGALWKEVFRFFDE